MGDGRDVPDHLDRKPGGLQRTQGRFPPGSGSLDKHIDASHSLFHGLFGRHFGG
jgi:hypothetical protein